MTVIDLITRVEAICKKYEKYDVDKQKDLNVAGDDAFACLYAVVEADLDAALQVINSLSLVILCSFLSSCQPFFILTWENFVEIGVGCNGEE